MAKQTKLDPRPFHIRLATALERYNMTVESLAADIQGQGVDVTAVTVRRWLSGATVPRFDMVPAIAAALNIDPNAVHGWRG